MQTEVLFATGKDEWETPDTLFEELNAKHQFTLDAAANSDNTKCPVWLGPGSVLAEDALAVSHWAFGRKEQVVWLNPPYSKGLQKKFVQQAHLQVLSNRGVKKVILLLPARTDTILFHTYIWDRKKARPHSWVQELDFIKGRIRFKGAEAGAPFPSMVVWFEL